MDLVIGTLTQLRLRNASIEDLALVIGMNRLRAAYAELDPTIERYQLRGDQHGRGDRTCPHPICQAVQHSGFTGQMKCQTTTRLHSTPSTSIPYSDSTRTG